jgi:reverse transcriptase-like protein
VSEIFISDSPREELIHLILTQTDVLRELQQLKANKSSGPSPIPTKVLKSCASSLAAPLHKLFQCFIIHQQLPVKLKTGEVVPIHKTGKPKDKLASFRGISIQPNFKRLFDRMMLNNFDPFVTRNNDIPEQQYRFKKGTGIDHQLIDLVYDVQSAFSDLHTTGGDIIFFDISSAFDAIPSEALVIKLKNIGVNGSFLNLIKDGLNERQQYVKFNNTSMPRTAKFGKIKQYADDTCLYGVIKSSEDLKKLQEDIDSFVNWCNNNGLAINKLKTKHLRVTLKRDFVLPSYTCDELLIETIVNSFEQYFNFLDFF